jgi:hypothetical protein
MSQTSHVACRAHGEYLFSSFPHQIRLLTTYFLFQPFQTLQNSCSGLCESFLHNLEGVKWWDWSQVSAPSPPDIMIILTLSPIPEAWNLSFGPPYQCIMHYWSPLWLPFARWVPTATLLPSSCPPRIHPFHFFLQLPSSPIVFLPTIFSQPSFSLFWTIFSHLPVTSTLPNNYTSVDIVYQGLILHAWSILHSCPCLPLLPPFSLFWTIYGSFIASMSVPLYLHMYIHEI